MKNRITFSRARLYNFSDSKWTYLGQASGNIQMNDSTTSTWLMLHQAQYDEVESIRGHKNELLLTFGVKVLRVNGHIEELSIDQYKMSNVHFTGEEWTMIGRERTKHKANAYLRKIGVQPT